MKIVIIFHIAIIIKIKLIGFCIYSTKEEVITSAQEVDVIKDELTQYANNFKETADKLKEQINKFDL